MFAKRDGLLDVFPYLFKHSELMGKECFSFDIEGKTYYFKNSQFKYQELVVNEIYKILGIPCVNYELIKLWNEYYLMSESFKKDGCTYISGNELLSDYLGNSSDEILLDLGVNIDRDGEHSLNNIENIWFSLEQKGYSKEDVKNIVYDIIRIYSMQIILLDCDLHAGNWEIEEQNNRATLVPKYDNEGCFSSDIMGIYMSVDGDDTFNSSVDSLNKFLNYSVVEDADIFYDLFKRCTIEVVMEAIRIVEQKYGEHIELMYKTVDANSVLSTFITQRERLESFLNKRKGRL